MLTLVWGDLLPDAVADAPEINRVVAMRSEMALNSTHFSSGLLNLVDLLEHVGHSTYGKTSLFYGDTRAPVGSTVRAIVTSSWVFDVEIEHVTPFVSGLWVFGSRPGTVWPRRRRPPFFPSLHLSRRHTLPLRRSRLWKKTNHRPTELVSLRPLQKNPSNSEASKCLKVSFVRSYSIKSRVMESYGKSPYTKNFLENLIKFYSIQWNG